MAERQGEGALIAAAAALQQRPHSSLALAAGSAVALLAILPPLGPLGSALFSAHMLQFVLLTDIAAPLLAMGLLDARSLRLRLRQRQGEGAAARQATSGGAPHSLTPLAVGLLDLAVLLLWHIPRVYAAARQGPLNWLELVSFLASGMVLWLYVAGPMVRREGRYAGAIACLVLTALPSSVLGLLLVVASASWYAIDPAVAAAWHLTPATDQQAAGAILLLPSDLLDAIGVAALLIAWLRASDAG